MQRTWLTLSTTLVAATFAFTASPTFAQVVPDGSLGTRVNGNPHFMIDGGTTAGQNLFHSFREFSVPFGGSAVFQNSPNIQNIFSRVTGGNQSFINGLIEAQGTANLFLINPAGIRFGSGAQLRLGGSFFGTTADRIIFNDGVVFNTNDPSEEPLLTINSPIGLNFNMDNPAPIQVDGEGHGLTIRSIRTSPVDRSEANPGLEVSSGNTLALIGGEVNLVGGVVRAPEGHIALAGVGEGQVSLTSVERGWRLGYEGVERFGDINLSQQAAVDASGLGRGSIEMVGRQVRLTGGSAGLIQNRGSSPAGDLTVKASEMLEVSGTDVEQTFPSLLFNETVSEGAGGQTNISTGNLLLSGGGIIHNKTYSSGDGGDVSVSAADGVEVNSFASDNPNIFSSLVAVTAGEGNAGNLSIETQDLSLLDGGNISNSTLGRGQAGNVTINASESITLIGFIPVSLRRTVLSNATATEAKGGTTLVNTSRLVIRDGATISASTVAEGSAGNLTINATDSIEVSGIGETEDGQLRAEILSDAPILPEVFRQATGLPDLPSGDAGSLTINTPRLTVSDGGRVGVGNQGTGTAGDLQIQANRIEVTNEGQITTATASGGGGKIDLQVGDVLLVRNQGLISTEVGEVGVQSQTLSANSGNITINGNLIQLLNQGEITVRNNGTGNAGDLQLQAYRLELRDGGRLTAETASGEGGNIELRVGDVLLLRNGGLISTEARGAGNGGDITINSPFVFAISEENSDIIANAFEGNGGNINIVSNSILGLEFRKNLTPLSDITASSQFGLSGTVTISNLNVNPTEQDTELESEVIDPETIIVQGCDAVGNSRFVVSGRGGTPENPRIRRSGVTTWHDIRNPAPYMDRTARQRPQPVPPIIEANAARRLSDGTMELYVDWSKPVRYFRGGNHQGVCP
ncbi:S-layer family protein [Roseofilum sp. Guam]|uniref:S-layer family protein n=1 Tax=Roseofilum sp. Guam TaxID=2821502 RepID=UPI001B2AADFF|nr:S-layer family protein [Roseofilum sp. Guam]MBP0027472.1 S-layer family protein [Roseofilum sp. Guam]